MHAAAERALVQDRELPIIAKAAAGREEAGRSQESARACLSFMSYLVYIDDNEAWCASSLRTAQLLAEGFICDLKALRIVSDKASPLERVWIYDYLRLQWV